MKRTYKTPIVKMIALSTEEGVLNVGSLEYGSKQAVGDNDDNFYSNSRNSIWGDE